VPPSARIPIEEMSQPAEARRLSQRLARQMGLDEVRAGAIAIVVTEAATNILKHARSGEILLQIAEQQNASAAPNLEMLSLDKGPGMQSVERCMRDGFTTASSPGHGLGAIRRLSGDSDFYSVPDGGTAILARWPADDAQDPSHGYSPAGVAHGRLRIGAVSVSKYGEEVCGDSWAVEQRGPVSTVLVADGLGHGFEASLASMEAVRVFRNNPELGPAALLDLVHRALRSFRGAAVSIARIDTDAGKVTFAGLGNIAGEIYSGSRRSQHMVSVNGTAGHNAARIREFEYEWPADGILVMHSDGLTTSAGLDGRADLALRDPSLIAGVLYRDFSRHNDDATVVVAKAA
jgi:anti-sigma regulatory factor (Ser/Thr protein kinase)